MNTKPLADGWNKYSVIFNDGSYQIMRGRNRREIFQKAMKKLHCHQSDLRVRRIATPEELAAQAAHEQQRAALVPLSDAQLTADLDAAEAALDAAYAIYAATRAKRDELLHEKELRQLEKCRA